MHSYTHDIAIRPIQPHEINEVREILLDITLKLQPVPCKDKAELIEIIEKSRDLENLNTIPEIYGSNPFVMLYDNTIIGMGTLKRLESEICELKRLFFKKKDFRGKGLGCRMLTHLLHRAVELGYKKMRLTIFNPANQQNALALYKKCGVSEIEPYTHTGTKLFLEKILDYNNPHPLKEYKKP